MITNTQLPKNRNILFIGFLLVFTIIHSQPKIKFGVGSGFSFSPDSEITEAFLDPADSTLQLDNKKEFRYNLSINLVVYPFDFKPRKKDRWEDAEWLLNRIGVISSIKLVELSGDSDLLISEEKIQGGMGIGFKFNNNLFLAWSYDLRRRRELRDFFEVGKKILKGGTPLENLDLDDDTLFTSKVRGIHSLNLIFTL